MNGNYVEEAEVYGNANDVPDDVVARLLAGTTACCGDGRN